MVRKLTLSLDEQVIRDARQLARRNGTSISGLFSSLVRTISAGRPRSTAGRRGKSTPKQVAEIGPVTRRLSGLVRTPHGVTDREIVEAEVLEKHGLVQ